MVVKVKYALIFREKRGKYEAFFPDIIELGKIVADSYDDMIDDATAKMRLYCAQNIKNLPEPSDLFENHKKYVQELKYHLVNIVDGVDEYHDGKRPISTDVSEEFEKFLKEKDIKSIEEYIKRYYENPFLDDSRFNLLVFEYYALIKNDKNFAIDAFEYFKKGYFPHNEFFKMELVDWMIDNDEGIRVFSILLYYEDLITEDKDSEFYGNKELLKQVRERISKIKINRW